MSSKKIYSDLLLKEDVDDDTPENGDILLIPISVGNIRAWIETGLRAMGGIPNKFDVTKITIPYSGFNDDSNERVVGVEVEIIEHYNRKGVELIRNEP